MDPHDGVIIVSTTTSTRQQADAIAETLVDERLAVCAQIEGPIVSVYRWKDSVERDEEYRVIVKTRREKWKALAARLQIIHSYDVPQIVATSCVFASPAYQEWVREQTS